MEYYSAIRKNEILPFATTWMEVESVTLSEISHTEKNRYLNVFTLMWILRNLTETHGGGEGKKKEKKSLDWEREPKHKRLLKTENKLRVDGGWEGGEG